MKGMTKFAEVTPQIYRGSQPNSEAFKKLADMGINIVIDLRGSRDGERKKVEALGMQYLPMQWRCFHPRDEVFASFLQLLRDHPDKKVFVHCRVGNDRTGMMVATYRMAEQGWTALEAENEMKAFGTNWFHRRICPTLSSYEKKFPEKYKNDPAFVNLRSSR